MMYTYTPKSQRGKSDERNRWMGIEQGSALRITFAGAMKELGLGYPDRETKNLVLDAVGRKWQRVLEKTFDYFAFEDDKYYGVISVPESKGKVLYNLYDQVFRIESV